MLLLVRYPRKKYKYNKGIRQSLTISLLCFKRKSMKKKERSKSLFENGRLAVNKNKVVFNSTLFDVPDFYEDKTFKCKKCEKEEVWTAKQQKWWYEEAQGDLETTAVLCRACRDFKKHQRDIQKEHDTNKT